MQFACLDKKGAKRTWLFKRSNRTIKNKRSKSWWCLSVHTDLDLNAFFSFATAFFLLDNKNTNQLRQREERMLQWAKEPDRRHCVLRAQVAEVEISISTSSTNTFPLWLVRKGQSRLQQIAIPWKSVWIMNSFYAFYHSCMTKSALSNSHSMWIFRLRFPWTCENSSLRLRNNGRCDAFSDLVFHRLLIFMLIN